VEHFGAPLAYMSRRETIRGSLTGRVTVNIVGHDPLLAGRVQMIGWTRRGKARAQRELDWELPPIIARIERLESPPPTTHTPQQIEELRAALLPLFQAEIASVEARMDGCETGLEDVETKMKNLTIATAEGIERVERYERRINATVQRARKQLSEQGLESSGLEAEAADLRIVDGGRSDESEVSALPTGLEPPSERASSVKGVPAATLARVRGY